MQTVHFLESTKACLANGERLLEDAEFLEFSKPPSTMFALSVIAQEEFAKGFLLVLVSRAVIPWNSLMYRVARDHCCKQLLGIVMDHMNPAGDLFFTQMDESLKLTYESMRLLDQLRLTTHKEDQEKKWQRIREINEYKAGLPASVADAINILRHEKIGRWQSDYEWEDDPQYDPLAKLTADRSLDREKQDALYVRLSRAGEVVCSPVSVSVDTARDAFDRAKRFGEVVRQLFEGNTGSLLDYEEIESAFKALFADNGPTLIVRKRKKPSS
jgi:hypothetical protein